MILGGPNVPYPPWSERRIVAVMIWVIPHDPYHLRWVSNLLVPASAVACARSESVAPQPAGRDQRGHVKLPPRRHSPAHPRVKVRSLPANTGYLLRPKMASASAPGFVSFGFNVLFVGSAAVSA